VAGSTAKKVVVRRFERENLNGFINPLSYLQAQKLELLRPDGALLELPYAEVKCVCFVKNFEAGAEPGRIFLNRPKSEGLWVRMQFRDGEVLDGLLPNDLLSWDTVGFLVTPPEPTEKIFVPREALRSIQILGVVGSPLTVKRKKGKEPIEQPTLF
jgi:hypothetical protein